MYIKEVKLKNVKSILDLTLNFEDKTEGWHVLLGMNGSGKSTILKAISLCLLGERQSYTLKEKFSEWITIGKEKAEISVSLSLNNLQDSLSTNYNMKATFHLHIDSNNELIFNFEANGSKKRMYPVNPEYGWYSSGFGPYRRLGKLETKSVSAFSDGNLENHITLFDSEFTLTNGIKWLQDLRFEELETKSPNSKFKTVMKFLNKSDFLPDNVTIQKVDHEGVKFKDGDFNNLSLNQLSDGYKSMFGLTVEILRQLSNRFDFNSIVINEGDKLVLIATGVIIIDEVDIHLHPQWQSKIGEWFKRNFPKIQFIVSCHSPIICQSANNSKIWRIEHPKSDRTTQEIVGQDYNRMVFGNILDSFSTDNFGRETVVRSEESQGLMKRLAELNIRSLHGTATESELKEIKDLRSILTTNG